MANIDTSKLVNFGNLQYYDQKIKDYTENKIKEINLSDLADDAEHRTVTDTDIKTWNEKSDFSGDYEDLSNIPSDLATTASVASALSEAKTYTDEEIAKFDFIKVVNELPEEGLENKIYLVPISSGDCFPSGEPGAYTDNTYTTLAYTWDELIARGNEVNYNDIYPEAHQPCFIVEDEYFTNYIFATDYCVIVPEGINGIWTEVGVKEIVLPASTTKMFRGEGRVDKIYIKATTPPPLEHEDYFCDFNYNTDHYGIVNIVVPQGCGDTYKSATNWSQYADYITEAEDTVIDAESQNLFDEWIWVNKGTEESPEYVWEWITTKQLEVELTEYATKEYVDTNKTQIVTTTGTGAAYVATVPGITSLTRGVSFVMVPHITSTSVVPTLNVNGFGAKGIRRNASSFSSTAQQGYSASWLASNYPITVMYDGTYWIVSNLTRPAAVDLSGTVSVAKGGTGATTLTANAVITGNGTNVVKTVSTASGALYATEENGAAQFGTLPIAQGGTGSTSEAEIVANLKSALVDLIYPIGSVYMSFESTNPGTLFGGTWEQLPDRFLLGAGSLGSGAQGGNSYLQLSAAIGAYDSNTAAIGYQATGPIPGTAYTYGGTLTGSINWIPADRINHSTTVYDWVQNTYTPSLYPPYITVYMWKRVSHVGHAQWYNTDITITPTLSANGRNLTVSCTPSINKSSYIATNNLRTTYTWYYQGYEMSGDTGTSIYMDNIGTYRVEVKVSGTLIDNEGCSSFVTRTGTAEYSFNG